jgi:hypothetical protein
MFTKDYNKSVKTENENASATNKQLFALYVMSKKLGNTTDYRNANLTRKQASEMIAEFKTKLEGTNTLPSKPKKARLSKEQMLKKEFLAHMETKVIPRLIEQARTNMGIKSVVEDDPSIFKDPSKRKQYVFFGFGCGFADIKFDKRSKIGKLIDKFGDECRMKECLQMFLKGFTKKEINYMQSVGFPLQAMYYQDGEMARIYRSGVIDLMQKHGVKNIHLWYYDD